MRHATITGSAIVHTLSMHQGRLQHAVNTTNHTSSERGEWTTSRFPEHGPCLWITDHDTDGSGFANCCWTDVQQNPCQYNPGGWVSTYNRRPRPAFCWLPINPASRLYMGRKAVNGISIPPTPPLPHFFSWFLLPVPPTHNQRAAKCLLVLSRGSFGRDSTARALSILLLCFPSSFSPSFSYSPVLRLFRRSLGSKLPPGYPSTPLPFPGSSSPRPPPCSSARSDPVMRATLRGSLPRYQPVQIRNIGWTSLQDL